MRKVLPLGFFENRGWVPPSHPIFRNSPLAELILRWFEALPEGPGKARGRARRPMDPTIARGEGPP